MNLLEKTILNYCSKQLSIEIEDSVEDNYQDYEFTIGNQVLVVLHLSLENVHEEITGDGYTTPREKWIEGEPEIQEIQIYFYDKTMVLSEEGEKEIKAAILDKIQLR